MRVCVFGLWHLGCITAACLADGGHDVVGLDPDSARIAKLREGAAPLFEPGLDALIDKGLASGRLRFETDADRSLAGADVVWVTFDTPVNDDDVPQVAAVTQPVTALVQAIGHRCLVLVSSQLPVGTTRKLAASNFTKGEVTFGYSPENLRLGKAIEVFTQPDRVIVGLQSEADQKKVSDLLAPFTSNIIWMGLEAAEMTKHAINAFLATSVVFMNEVSTICEKVGADAKEVERGLKSEQRIGPRAYLSPGGAFAGGTLARDVVTLADLGQRLGVPVTLVSAVRASNNEHRSWERRKLKERLGSLASRRIALLGLTYKPGTNTLRRSSAVELALALHEEGAQVAAFDPAIEELPSDLRAQITLARSPAEAMAGADAVVLATAWPEFRDIDWSQVIPKMKTPIVIDTNSTLSSILRDRTDVAYTAVGLPWTNND
jgi:UDPglucose 6-dehydrogenase